MILTDDDRSKLLEALKLAPDNVLLSAVNEMKHCRIEEQQMWDGLKGFVGAKPAPKQAAEQQAPTSAPDDEEQDEFNNVEPEGMACTRIGSKNKDAILAYCMSGRAKEEIAAFIHKKDPSDLLKLLWERGELLFDGELFYTPGE